MDLPITGAILLILGIYAFFASSRLLYAAMVFLIPFSATAIVNLNWGEEQKGISAWLFFGALWILQSVLGPSPPWRQLGWRPTQEPRRQLYLFLLVVLASLSVPLILNGTITVRYFRLNSTEGTPLHLSGEHFTQFAYLALGILVTIFVAAKNCEPEDFLRSVKIYVASATFVAAWGAFQFWCNMSGVEYPSFLFNTSLTESAQLYNERVQELDLSRISSVAIEPSIFAQACLVAAIFLMVSIGLGRPIFSKKWDWMGLLLIVTVLILSTSTTAYFGLMLALVLMIFTLYRAGSLSKVYLVIGCVMAVGTTMGALAIPFVRDFVAIQIAGKDETGSGLERLYSIYLAAQYFRDYPVLGLGWGSITTTDMVLKLLSNTGLIGFIAFAIFLIGVFKSLWKASTKRKPWVLQLFATFLLMVVLSEVSGFPYAAGHLWFVLGLGIAAPALSYARMDAVSLRRSIARLRELTAGTTNTILPAKMPPMGPSL
jgi:O-antigen ligase